ncbi:hypothetical protein IWZ00DRAFT_135698 [Phyllosticta capitalensis]
MKNVENAPIRKFAVETKSRHGMLQELCQHFLSLAAKSNLQKSNVAFGVRPVSQLGAGSYGHTAHVLSCPVLSRSSSKIHTLIQLQHFPSISDFDLDTTSALADPLDKSMVSLPFTRRRLTHQTRPTGLDLCSSIRIKLVAAGSRDLHRDHHLSSKKKKNEQNMPQKPSLQRFYSCLSVRPSSRLVSPRPSHPAGRQSETMASRHYCQRLTPNVRAPRSR